MAKNKFDAEDDGRVIAPMNVDGMPWYLNHGKQSDENPSSNIKEQLTPSQRRAFMFGVLKAILLIFSVYFLVFFLFLLFCSKVWFA
jgi:hypothetical protein